MTKNRQLMYRYAFIGGCSALFALPITLVSAASENLLPSMVITAARTAENAASLPVTISTVDDKQLELDQGVHIQDSTRLMAGVTINQLSGSSSHNTGIRMPMNYQGYYLFLQDSIPLQSSAFFNHNGLRWSSYNTNTNRIEVLKGAGSTLYGSGAVAASINVLSDDPKFAPEGKVTLLAGEHDYGQLRLSYTNAINEDQAFSISASALNSGGWREHTSRDRQELLLKHLWLLSENTELKTQLQLSTMTDEMAAALKLKQYVSDPTLSGLSPSVQAINPERNSDFVRLSFELSHQLNDQLSLNFIPYYRHNTNDYIATWRSYTPQSDSTVNSFGLLAKGTWLHQNDSETLFGVDLEHSVADSFSYQPLNVTVNSWGGSSKTYSKGVIYQDNRVVYKNISPYVQHNWRLTPELLIQAGLRYDFNHYELDNHIAKTDNDGFGNRQLADRSDTFTSLNPKLGFHYRLNDHSGAYGRLAQANRLPTASTLYRLKSGDSGSLVGGIDAESSITTEVGYRYQQDDLNFSMAVYRMDINDAIVSAIDTNGDSYKTNAGKTRHQGLEVELSYRFTPSLNFNVAASHSKHQFMNYINKGKVYSGNEMMRAPRNKFSASINWSPKSIEGLDTELQLDYFGRYWKDDKNTEKAASYTLVNLKGQYQLAPQFTLFARIDNLLDRKYAYQNELSWGRDKFYPGNPRNFKAGVQYQW